MPFTAAELENAFNASIDYHIKGAAKSQTLQIKPLLKAMRAKRRTYPGTNEFVDTPVKGDYSGGFEGFRHDDEVHFENPANIKRAKVPWYQTHIGLTMTSEELLKNGISFTDTMTGENTTSHSEAERIRLTNVLEDKVSDRMEAWERRRLVKRRSRCLRSIFT